MSELLDRIYLRAWAWIADKAFRRLSERWPSEWADHRWQEGQAGVKTIAPMKHTFLMDAHHNLVAERQR